MSPAHFAPSKNLRVSSGHLISDYIRDAASAEIVDPSNFHFHPDPTLISTILLLGRFAKGRLVSVSFRYDIFRVINISFEIEKRHESDSINTWRSRKNGDYLQRMLATDACCGTDFKSIFGITGFRALRGSLPWADKYLKVKRTRAFAFPHFSNICLFSSRWISNSSPTLAGYCVSNYKTIGNEWRR